MELEVGHCCLRADAGLGWLKSTESSRPAGRAGCALHESSGRYGQGKVVRGP